ncbi:MAG TPA: RNA polymerase sigma-70 factor [Candidatus Barnesiella excrementigallinarum]|nr:RNA polymerase sigma-70 factor [Candidatus Barnesiella excrementigallinarum]
MDDFALTIQLKQGNRLAFTILYNTYSEQAYRLAFKYLCNKELAEDAVQNLFMKVWTKRASLDENRPLNHFLFTILKNDLLNILRDSKNNIFVLDDCLELLERIDGDNQDNDDIDKEQLELIRRAVDQLSPQRKKIFSLKVSGKYTNQEIADKLHLSVNTIKFQYSQSLKQIKEFIRQCAISLLM